MSPVGVGPAKGCIYCVIIYFWFLGISSAGSFVILWQQIASSKSFGSLSSFAADNTSAHDKVTSFPWDPFHCEDVIHYFHSESH